ncbi:dynein heavy chain 7, axonemal-like [Trichogramma pretiosum]|uniref:dynein heavy chain 7, axonemal-like n=1 Tax=Trichogramma pretiosum TaxID=7493 RepID=UPI0006C9DB78|nr:dynein heavy chain 7, axonemal-like [Trichogramma pretiosum]
MAEKQELYKLINDRTRMPRLQAAPQLHNNNLFNRNEQQQQQSDLLQRFRSNAMKIVKNRPVAAASIGTPTSAAAATGTAAAAASPASVAAKWKKSVNRLSRQTLYTEELRKLAKQVPVQGLLLPEWEQNIMRLIPRTNKRKHFAYLRGLMKEVRQDYFDEMQNFSVKSIVADREEEEEKEEKVAAAPLSLESSSGSFETNRRVILYKYFLSHRLVRSVSNVMYYNLPKNLLSLKRYEKVKELVQVSWLRDATQAELQKSATIIKKQCYQEIVRSMLQMGYLRADKRLPRLLHCAESFMAQRICQAMMATIDELVAVLAEGSGGSSPRLKLQLVCRNDRLEIEPSVRDVYALYHGLIDGVANLAQDLVPLSEWLKASDANEQQPTTTSYVKVRLADWYLEESHAKLQSVLEAALQPLERRLEELAARLEPLFEARARRLRSLSGPGGQVQGLSRSPAIADLKRNGHELVSTLLAELVDLHQSLNREICREFESLESRALDIPDDTQSLFELTEYVSYASKQLMGELEDKIRGSVRMLGSLSEVALLSHEHLELNATTCNWLELIKPVFSQHNIFCEAKKGELEDELQRKIAGLGAEIEAVLPELACLDAMDDAARVHEYSDFLGRILARIEEISERCEQANAEERLFKFPETSFPKVDEIKEAVCSFSALVQLICRWRKERAVWLDGPFEYLDSELIERQTEHYTQRLTESHRVYKLKIKTDQTASKPFKFSGVADDPDPMQQPAPLKLCWQTLRQLDEFRRYVPLARCMCNPALRKRHWDEMSEIAGCDLTPNAGTTLAKLMGLDLLEDFASYEVISRGANNELALQHELQAMQLQWQQGDGHLEFGLVHREQSGLTEFRELDAIEALLEEQLVKLAKMRSSYFVGPIEPQVREFHERLSRALRTIELWNHVQARCKYLGGIFAERLVREHLAHELDLYESLREILGTIEAGIQTEPSFDRVTASRAAVLDKLEQADRALELVASKVRDYLKRLKLEFSRLFFLADVEMVELLFRRDNLARSNCQISKCFPNVSRLKLAKDTADGSLEIVAITGTSGERLDLPEPVELAPTSGDCLADWLRQLDRAMRRALRDKLELAIETFNDELSFDWLAASPASVVHCVWQIMWTAQVQSCFSAGVVESMRECRQRYQAYRELAHQLLRHQTLSREHRETLSSLVVLLVHLEEVCGALLEKKIHEEQDFDWKAQIRYYYYNQEEANEAEVRVSIVNSSQSYGYEYYGSGERVSVITPLTERYYRALVEASQQNHFTGLVGLACLGKIDAKRNLARILGQPFFLFGGREAQRYDNLEAIFKGLVGLNAWVCFKNLGECSLPNLSLLAQYVFRVCQAKSARQATINVHGDQLRFDANCYFSYSMNPGLGGRVDAGSLPDNLRSHFRQVCFLAPDQDKICQVELYAAGFAEARQLSAVLSEVNALCNELMSSSSTAEYNLKLRSSKALVATAAKLKFSHPEESERLLLLRALVDTRISQFHGEDLLVFRDILDKCFTGVAFRAGPSHERLLAALERVCRAERLLLDRAAFELKLVQMHETIHLSKSVILVGEAASGKTTLLRVLREVLTLLRADGDDDDDDDRERRRATIPCEVINPGALSLARFIGSYDEDEASWSDGVLCDVLRKFSDNHSDNDDHDDQESALQKWLILDSDAHESWLGRIETMLAEPDRVLHLATNERLVVPDDTRLFIETTSLRDCSPATLARCALVHLPGLADSWPDYARNELAKRDEPRQLRAHCPAICAMFHWCLEASLRFVRDHCSSNGLKLSEMQLVGSCLDLFIMYISSAVEDHNLEHNKREAQKDKDKDHALLWSQAALLMATNFALSGHLDADSKLRLEKFLLDLWADRNELHPKPREIKHPFGAEIALPSEGQLRDNVYVFKGTGNWRHLASDLLKMEKIKDDKDDRQLLLGAASSDLVFVPTVESLKFNHLLSLHVRYRRPFIVCGEYAAGKTCLLRDFFTQATSSSSSELTSCYFNFQSIASAELAQELVLMRLQRIRRTEYQAQDNKYCVVVVDDLQAAADRDPSSTSSTLESMRQLMDRGYWHDLETPGRRVAVSNKVAFAGALTTTSHRNLCPRFLRHFNVLGMSAPTRESTCRVFSTSLMADLRRNSNFSQDVLGSVTSMAQATLDVYRACRLELRPSPARLLYRFSLHDVQRVVKGCALVHKDSVETKITFVRLWAHEVLRVFGDRIRDPAEQRWLFERMREAAKAHFKDPFEAAFDHLPKQSRALEAQVRGDERLLAGPTAQQAPAVRGRLQRGQQQRRGDQRQARADLLATPGANLLALGTSGSGAGALVKLAAFIERQRVFEPALDSLEAWRQQLKSLMIECGTSKRHSCVLLVSERKIKADEGGGVRDDVNELLLPSYGPGEIAARLFSEDERREMVRAARLDAQQGDRNLELDAWRVYGYFLEQCKRRLHLVLRVSPRGPSLRRCLRDWPGLLSSCTIDWLDDWPQPALEQVAHHCLRGLNVPDSLRSQLVLASQQLYLRMDRVRAAYCREAVAGIEFPAVAPLGFLRTCKRYAELMAAKQLEIKSTRKRYLAGLDKLQLAAREVAHMKTTLTKLRPQLEASARQTETTMKEIESENLSVERATVLVKRDEEVANKKAEIASTLKLECETELAVAIPILEDALAALNTLKPTDITLVKAMKNPPDTVKLVMAAVCVMLGVPSERVVDPVTGRKSMDFWGPSKRVLGDMNFLQNLKDYDKDSIAPAVVATIKKNYMSDKNFQPHIVAKASSAAEGLCKWVRAMVSYDEVAKVVAPKKEKLAAAQRECDETEAFLTAKRKTLADLSAKLAGLKQSLEATLRKKLELEREVADCTLKLRKAEELIGSLGGEKARWTVSADQLGRAYDNLPGDALLSCATIGYLAPLDLAYRDKTLADWQDSLRTAQVPFSEEFDLVDFLGVEVTINAWRLCGLANNRFSLQNAIMWEQSPMWCLFVDPQNQANEWIRSMEKSSQLRTVKANEPDSLSRIVEGMGLGVPVLLENVADELEAGLEPLLAKDGGGCSVPREPGFRLYLTTRRQRPRFGAQVFNRLTVMDFLLPAEAIRDRLLDIVIARERPELQDKFEKILAENVNNKRILKQQEDNILRTLSSGSGTGSVNILEDEGAIRTLDISKSLAQDLLKRQEATRVSKEEIEAFRDGYQAFTKYCADLYSTLNWLPSLNCMYRFSLSWFTQLYVKSIETSNRSVIHRKRIDYLKMSSIQNLYQSVHGALLERHRLVYSFVLCAKTLVDTEQLTEQEFRVFMSIGGAAAARASEKEEDGSNSAAAPNPAPAWLSEASWRELQLVSSQLAVFQNLANSLSNSAIRWRRYCNSLEADECPMPQPWDHRLTPFQKLILVRILCPDRIIFKVTEFVESVMGPSSGGAAGNFVPCNVARPYAESSCLVPLIFILPSYTSPFAVVTRFAKLLGYSSKLHSLSMGPRQGPKAELLIEMARRDGEWVFLHNCHLALDWMHQRLETLCEQLDPSTSQLGFRLWMSSRATEDFPIGLLQASIKVAFDAPHDVRQSLAWSYRSEPIKDRDFFEGCPGKDRAFGKLLYGFCLLHAVLRERANYGLQSWNRLYEFDEADLHSAVYQLRSWVGQSDKLPFKALGYFLSECGYGAKMLDPWDKLYLDSLALDYCNFKLVQDSNYDFDTGRPAYRLPKRIEFRDYLRHIRNNVPAQTSPEDFGLDRNCTLAKNSLRVGDFLGSLASLNETSCCCASTTMTSEQLEARSHRLKSICLESLSLLPKSLSLERLESRYNQSGSDEPLNRFLREEVAALNDCLDAMRRCLEELSEAHSGHAADGSSCWSRRLEELSAELLRGGVPSSWQRLHLTLRTNKTLFQFLGELCERVKFLEGWIERGQHPRHYWCAGLMSCRKLLAIVRWSYAREQRCGLDEVGLECSVLEAKCPPATDDSVPIDDSLQLPTNAVCLYGLQLVGAKWNEQTKSLTNPRPKLLFNEMPLVSFEPVSLKSSSSQGPPATPGFFRCPLYVSPLLHNLDHSAGRALGNVEPSRDNYVASVNLKSDVNPRLWIKRGAALYCRADQ